MKFNLIKIIRIKLSYNDLNYRSTKDRLDILSLFHEINKIVTWSCSLYKWSKLDSWSCSLHKESNFTVGAEHL